MRRNCTKTVRYFVGFRQKIDFCLQDDWIIVSPPAVLPTFQVPLRSQKFLKLFRFFCPQYQIEKNLIETWRGKNLKIYISPVSVNSTWFCNTKSVILITLSAQKQVKLTPETFRNCSESSELTGGKSRNLDFVKTHEVLHKY